MADKAKKTTGKTSSGKTTEARQNRHAKIIIKAETIKEKTEALIASCMSKYNVTRGQIRNLIGTLNIRRLKDLENESIMDSLWFNNRVPSPSLYAIVKGTKLEKFTNFMKRSEKSEDSNVRNNSNPKSSNSRN
jgi:hypothetical protein